MAVKTCSECNAQFANGSNLRRHERKFGHGRPYTKPYRDTSTPEEACCVCNRVFSSMANRAIHEKAIHRFEEPAHQTGAGYPNVPTESDSESETDDEEESDEEGKEGNDTQGNEENGDEENEDQGNDDDGNDDNGNDDDGNDDDKNEDDGTEDDEEDAEEEQTDYWRDLISEAYDQLEALSPSEVTEEPHLTRIVEEMRKIMKYQADRLHQFQTEDDTYHHISNRVDKYEEEGLDEDTASEIGWNEHRILVRKIIEENLDLFEEEKEEEEEGSDDDQDSVV